MHVITSPRSLKKASRIGPFWVELSPRVKGVLWTPTGGFVPGMFSRAQTPDSEQPQPTPYEPPSLASQLRLIVGTHANDKAIHDR